MALLPAFTSFWGSILHPFLMIFIFPAWILVLVLGIQARKKRLSPDGTSESTGLLSGVTSDNKAHHKLAAATFFFTVCACLIGMANTYSRSGRLYPGTHLYGGLAIILAGSFNVALVPWFKDQPKARLPHAAMGVVLIFLLAVQLKTGWKILGGVWRHFH